MAGKVRDNMGLSYVSAWAAWDADGLCKIFENKPIWNSRKKVWRSDARRADRGKSFFIVTKWLGKKKGGPDSCILLSHSVDL